MASMPTNKRNIYESENKESVLPKVAVLAPGSSGEMVFIIFFNEYQNLTYALIVPQRLPSLAPQGRMVYLPTDAGMMNVSA